MKEITELLNQISQHIGTCCAITMEPDEVQELIDKLKDQIQQLIKTNNKRINGKKL